jgi:hypothetical protein
MSPSSLERSAAGSITGILAVRVGDFVFPEEGWVDFPVVVLGWWDAAQSVHAGQPGRFMFMDGPFEFTVSPSVNGTSAVAFAQHTAGGSREVRTGSLDPADLLEAITRAAAELATECRNRGWSGKDVRDLSYAIS